MIKDRLAESQDNVSEWSDTSIFVLLLSKYWSSTKRILFSISLKSNIFSPWSWRYRWSIASLASNNQNGYHYHLIKNYY